MNLIILFLSDFSHSKFKKHKALKKNMSKELMPIAWHPKRWWNFFLSEDEKKEIKPTFTN